jgi:hypothetical protein
MVTVGGVGSNGVTCTVLQIRITWPTEGMVLNQPSTVVTGTLPPVSGEFAVVVNGRYAMINGQDFAINNVELSLGENTIAVTVNTQNGETPPTSITVFSNNQNAYVRLNSGAEAGLSPMTATVTLDTRLPTAVTGMDLTVDGSGSGAVTFPYQLTLQGVGIVQALVTVTTADSLTYQDRFAFNVLDHDATEALLRSKWNNMQTALLSGDMTGALSYFSSQSQGDYQAILTNIQSSLQRVFSTIEAVHLLSVTNDYAEMEAIRNEGGQLFSYPIFFSLDETGAWKINSF